MKKIILILFMINNLFCQEKVTKVEYDFFYKINEEGPYKDRVRNDTVKSYLYYNDNKSIFNYILGSRSIRKKVKLGGFLKYLGSDLTTTEHIKNKDSIGEYQSIDYINKLTYEKKYGLSSFLYYKLKDSLFLPKWKLSSKKKIINGYKCKKAKTTYYGREYIVWYTEDIKTNKGPWKLNGLSGLIVYAYSDDDKLSWTLRSIKDDIIDMNFYFKYDDTKKKKLKDFFISEKKKSLEKVNEEKKEGEYFADERFLKIFKGLGSKNAKKDLEESIPDDVYDYNVIEKDYKPYKK